MPRDRAQRRSHPLAGHVPRLVEPINQLIPQVLPIRARAVHSRQYLRQLAFVSGNAPKHPTGIRRQVPGSTPGRWH